MGNDSVMVGKDKEIPSASPKYLIGVAIGDIGPQPAADLFFLLFNKNCS